MKIEKLTENKIRIVLNIDELSETNIDYLSLTKHTEETQKLFKKILKRAEKEVDFHVEDCRLLIEAFISSDGFFIITFTKLDSAQDIPVGVPTKIKIKKKEKNQKEEHLIYEFYSLEDFLDFCTYIQNLNLVNLKDIFNKIAFYEYNKRLFLIVSKTGSYNSIPFFNSAISEFSNLISTSSVFTSKIFEFGKPIFK